MVQLSLIVEPFWYVWTMLKIPSFYVVLLIDYLPRATGKIHEGSFAVSMVVGFGNQYTDAHIGKTEADKTAN